MWIPTPEGHVFAWYHAPTISGTRRCAVLLCDPFGWNRMALHLTYRHIALGLAAAGFAVLRVDYPGTCDSEGSPRHSARVEKWLNSLDVAADRLMEWSGARELGLCGVLLGGTLGMLLAKRRRDVGSIILWEPYLNGRAWLRTGIAATATVNSNPEGLRPSTAVEGDREVLGFLLTQGMIDDVSTIDLLRTPPSAVRSALILARPELSAGAELARHLSSSGIAVDLQKSTKDTLDDILLSIGAGYPRQTIQDIVAWMVREHPQIDGAEGERFPSLCPHEVLLQGQGNPTIRETAVFLGAESAVFGIVSEPVEFEPCSVGVVLVSAGANHRSGINRNYTEWARSLAMRGHRVLRFDLRGLGDSPRSGPDDVGVLGRSGMRNEVFTLLYRDDARKELLEAVRWLRERGTTDVACVGLCAGGYQAFHAARSDSSISSVVMLNPLRFKDESIAMTGSDLIPSEGWRRAIRRSFGSRGRIRRTLRFVREVVGHVLPWGTSGTRMNRRIALSFVELSDRGIDVCVVYNDNEQMLGILREALRPVRAQLESAGRFQIQTVGHADHIYSPLWIQEAVSRFLLDYVQRLPARLAGGRNLAGRAVIEGWQPAIGPKGSGAER